MLFRGTCRGNERGGVSKKKASVIRAVDVTLLFAVILGGVRWQFRGTSSKVKRSFDERTDKKSDFFTTGVRTNAMSLTRNGNNTRTYRP